MKKQKVNFMDEMEFDNCEYAKQLYIKESKRLKLKIICALISILTPLSWYFLFSIKGNPELNDGILESILNHFLVIGMGATIISNPLQIIKTTWKLIVFGWSIAPFIFIDFIAVILCFWFSLVALFFVPTIHCVLGIYQSYQNKKEAEVFCMLNNVEV